MGTQGENGAVDEQDEFRFKDEDLSPEEEAALRGDAVDDPEDTDDDDIDEDALAALAGDDDDGKGGSPMVPHARFHEVNERAKELERQLEEERASKNPPENPPAQKTPEESEQEYRNGIKDLEKQYNEAMFNGDADVAADIRMQINSAIEARAEERALEKMRAAAAQEKAQERQQQVVERFNAVVEQMEKEYPQLDVNSESADPEAIAMVVALRDQYIQAGKDPAEALEAAAKRTAERLGFAAQSPAAGQQGNRQQETLRRNAQAASQQPPRMNAGMSDRALTTRSKSVTQMTDKEFDNMDPEQERNLRGEA